MLTSLPAHITSCKDLSFNDRIESFSPQVLVSVVLMREWQYFSMEKLAWNENFKNLTATDVLPYCSLNMWKQANIVVSITLSLSKV